MPYKIFHGSKSISGSLTPWVSSGDRWSSVSSCGLDSQPSVDTEAMATLPAHIPGTFSRLTVFTLATIATNPRTITFQKNGADTALTFTIPVGAGSGIYENIMDEVDVIAGDTFSIKFPQLPSGSGPNISFVGAIFVPSSGNVEVYQSSWRNNGLDRASPNPGFSTFAGDYPRRATFDNVSVMAVRSFFAQNLHIYITGTTNRVLNHRHIIDGLVGAVSFNNPSGVTGYFETLTGIDSIIIGERFGYGTAVVSGSFTIALSRTGCNVRYIDDRYDIVSGSRTLGVSGSNCTRSASVTDNFFNMVGSLQVNTSLITNQLSFQHTGNIKGWRAYFSSNTYSTNVSYRLQKNGVDTGMVLTILAGISGEYQELSSQVDFIGTDLFNMAMTGGTAGSLVFQYNAFSIEAEFVAPPFVPPNPGFQPIPPSVTMTGIFREPSPYDWRHG